MQRASTGDGVFKCAVGETVTVNFVAHNTDTLITYRVDEEPPRPVTGGSLSLTFGGELTILRVFFDFNGPGGSYDVTLSGSGGGNFPDPPPVRESHGLVQTRRYAFIR